MFFITVCRSSYIDILYIQMAEARHEEEGQGERRDLLDRSQTTDHLERTKPEHSHSSLGPLSSIRAAIKRTRASSQSDIRDRRRSEITIFSAEPLVSNNWFPGRSVIFPPPQSGWSAGIQAASQVIKEKTQEEHTAKPTAAPRRSTCTTTSGTQTDPEREEAAPTVVLRGAAPPPAEKRSAGKKPQKPPRPSLSKRTDGKFVTKLDKEVSNNTVFANTEKQSDSESNVNTVSSRRRTGSVTVHWDISTKSLPVPTESTPSSANSDPSQRPIPRPRTKSRKQVVEKEIEVQKLVKISETSEDTQSNLKNISSNKYLKDLLEVFYTDIEFRASSNVLDQSDLSLLSEDAAEEMNGNQNQNSFRARIQAFESQAAIEEGSTSQSTKPAPPLKKALSIPPPVAAKPSATLRPQFSLRGDVGNQNIPALPQNETPDFKPQFPQKPVGLSVKEELEAIHAKTSAKSRPVLTRTENIYEEIPFPLPPEPQEKPVKKPLKPNLNINNHNSASVVNENEYVDSLFNSNPFKPQHNGSANGGSLGRQSVHTRRPTTIRVPSKTNSLCLQDDPPPLPAQKPVGSLNSPLNHRHSLSFQSSFSSGPQPSLPPRKPSVNKSFPPRPPPAKPGPGRPSPPSFQATGRSHSATWETSPKSQAQKPQGKGLDLPPRPRPGHRLYNKYTLPLPHGIAAFDSSGSNSGELSFQKNEVLLLLKEINYDEFECQVGENTGIVHRSHMKVITPLDSDTSPPQGAAASGGEDHGLKVQAVFDFTPEGPGELSLRTGDVVTMVEEVNDEWYRGSCRGSTGFFPVNYVKVLSSSPKPLPVTKPKPPPTTVSGPRCVARFDFEGEHSDELSFSEGDMIQLKEYVGQDWARGQIGNFIGIFPLSFVEVIEDLPPAPNQQQSTKFSLPGMDAASSNTHPEVAEPAQSSVEWVVALYDYTGKTQDELFFQQGDHILVVKHTDDNWGTGRLNGREGLFPWSYVEATTGHQMSTNPQNGAVGGGRAQALYNFTSDCEEELCLQIGDIITNIESIDDEWFLGDLRGKRAMVPKNYVQEL
ncbi:SH3 domain-containing protein 19 isoform 2-T2 [Pholidichthys leucotaenia]